MFEVLAFVYENYEGSADCPALPALHRQLSRVGFRSQPIDRALTWLLDLRRATAAPPLVVGADDTLLPPRLLASGAPMRVLSSAEQAHLGADSWSYLCFLQNQGVLNAQSLEVVLERALAAPGGPMAVDDFKLLVLMLFWNQGLEPDTLMLDELTDSSEGRVTH
jgi:Smg protein